MALGDPQPELLAHTFQPGPAPGGPVTPAAGAPPEIDELQTDRSKWDDDVWRRVVVNDFLRAESRRRVNQEMEWDDAERIYFANVPQRSWDGTNVPRSSIGVRLAWHQVEAIRPRVADGLFNTPDGVFFECAPEPGTSAWQSLAYREFVAWQLNEAGLRTEMDSVVKSGAQYGTGILKLSWLKDKQRKFRYEDAVKVQRILGIPISRQRVTKKRAYDEEVNRPELTFVEIRDFYIDPAVRRTHVPDAKFVIHRGTTTFEELLEMKNDPDYNIPSEAELREYIRNKQGPQRAIADQSKNIAARESGAQQANSPEQSSVDLLTYPFERLEYWCKDYLVTVLERKWTIYNKRNDFGFIPFYAVSFVDVQGQFYGKGLPWILADEQRIQQGLINARLDELALSIHGQMVYNEGMVINKSQLRPRPGGAISVTGDVGQALKMLERQPVATEAFAEVGQSQLRAQQYTGITDLLSSGLPTAGATLGRTRIGAAALTGGGMTRIQFYVDQIAENILIPLLKDIKKLNALYLNPDQPLEILGPALGRLIQTKAGALVNGEYHHIIKAANRMHSRQLMQQTLPELLQIVLNPGVMAMMQMQGTMPNINAIMRDVQDILGWRATSDWFQPISPEQQQQMAQQQDGEAKSKLEREQMRLQFKQQLMEQQNSFNASQTILQQALKDAPGAASAAVGDALNEINQTEQ